jgi:hypothetical protein
MSHENRKKIKTISGWALVAVYLHYYDKTGDSISGSNFIENIIDFINRDEPE